MPALLAAALLFAAATAAKPAPEFPATDRGRRAEAYIAAYNRDDAALAAFFDANLSAEGKQRRPAAERVAVLHGLRENHGRLTVTAVREVPPDSLSVDARPERGAPLTLDFRFEPQPPHWLEGVRITAGGAGPAAEGPPMTEEQVATALRDHLVSLGDAFSGAVLLARGNRVLLRQAYGLASREGQRPNTPETLFNLGSINKVFTRLAVEQLAAAGTLSLTDTLDRWVPEYPVDKGRRITLQQLLDHRAGTRDFFGARYNAADHARDPSSPAWPRALDELGGLYRTHVAVDGMVTHRTALRCSWPPPPFADASSHPTRS